MSARRPAAAIALLGLAVAAGIGMRFAGAQPGLEAAAVRFAAVDVYLESAEPLAAWQFELTEATGTMAVVGVENGESAAFGGTPHYDLDAVARGRADRIVVADYSLAESAELPRGRTRVATVHVRLDGTPAPDLRLQLIAAGDADGESVPAAASFEFQDGRTE